MIFRPSWNLDHVGVNTRSPDQITEKKLCGPLWSRYRPITLAWILTGLLPFFYLEKSWLMFCVQVASPQPLKVIT